LKLQNTSGRIWQLGESQANGRFSIYDSTASREVIGINSSGNVGIGTSNPNSIFDVASSSAKFTLRSTAATASVSMVFQPAGGASTSNQNAFTLRAGGLAGAGGEKFDILNGAGTTLISIASTGNLGIGRAASTSAKVDINGRLNATAITINGVNVGAGGSQWTTTGNDIYYTTGNIGIGTSVPVEKLNVNGNVSFGNGARAIGLSGGTKLGFDRGSQYFTGFDLLVGATSGLVVDAMVM